MLLIDGYNLLRVVENLLEESSQITDIQLCKTISEYLYSTRKKGCIVFDGTGPRDKTDFENLFNLEVIFSGSNREADDVIEQLIIQDTAPKNLDVVSDDNRIQAAANKRKATSVDCVQFWAKVITQLERKKRKPIEPKGKFVGISEAETEYWLREFGLLK